jgi:hypothetical protein
LVHVMAGGGVYFMTRRRQLIGLSNVLGVIYPACDFFFRWREFTCTQVYIPRHFIIEATRTAVPDPG